MIKRHRRFKSLVLASGWILLTGLLFSGCADSGRTLFHRQGCINCHRFQGEGGMLGPDLTAVAERRSRSWIDQYIQNPAAENTRARMPSFPHLSRGERQALIDFLFTKS